MKKKSIKFKATIETMQTHWKSKSMIAGKLINESKDNEHLYLHSREKVKNTPGM